MKRVQTKVAFFIDKKRKRLSDGHYLEKEVTAAFVDDKPHNICDNQLIDSYAHVGQHSTAAIEYFAKDCRPATYDEYKPLYDEMNELVGYDMEVVDAAWWIAKAMDRYEIDGEDWT